MVRHQVATLTIGGSTPLLSLKFYGGRSSIGRAPDCESGRFRFESGRSHHYIERIFMEFTGERMIEGCPDVGNFKKHVEMHEKFVPFIYDKEVLDIASGSGYGTFMFSKYASKVVGVDISKEAVEFSKEKYQSSNMSFQCGSILEIPFDADIFDVVTSIETFEHVEKRFAELMISECNRVLKRKGYYLFTTPNEEVYPFERVKHLVPYHSWHYTKNELVGMLAKIFKYVDITDVSGELTVICFKG